MNGQSYLFATQGQAEMTAATPCSLKLKKLAKIRGEVVKLIKWQQKFEIIPNVVYFQQN